MTGEERWHGTAGGYSNHNCKCARCRRAWADAVRRFRAARRRRHADGFTDFRHGASGYREWKCRCQVCRSGSSAEKKLARASR